jgi:hypothetical protein
MLSYLQPASLSSFIPLLLLIPYSSPNASTVSLSATLSPYRSRGRRLPKRKTEEKVQATGVIGGRQIPFLETTYGVTSSPIPYTLELVYLSLYHSPSLPLPSLYSILDAFHTYVLERGVKGSERVLYQLRTF